MRIWFGLSLHGFVMVLCYVSPGPSDAVYLAATSAALTLCAVAEVLDRADA